MTIDQLNQKIEEDREEAKHRQKKLEEMLLRQGIKLDDIQDDLTETKEEVKQAKSFLKEKSSTMNQENFHHYFTATIISDGTRKIVNLIAGQKAHHKTNDPIHTANDIDLRVNAYNEFLQKRKDTIKRVNDDNEKADNEFNENLKREIKAHNATNTSKRKFCDEKRKTAKIRLKDISVEFSKLKFVYEENPYMSFEEVLNIVKHVHKITV